MEQDKARIEQFLDALWLKGNLAENTISSYRRDLTTVAEWLQRQQRFFLTVQALDLQALLAGRIDGGL